MLLTRPPTRKRPSGSTSGSCGASWHRSRRPAAVVHRGGGDVSSRRSCYPVTVLAGVPDLAAGRRGGGPRRATGGAAVCCSPLRSCRRRVGARERSLVVGEAPPRPRGSEATTVAARAAQPRRLATHAVARSPPPSSRRPGRRHHERGPSGPPSTATKSRPISSRPTRRGPNGDRRGADRDCCPRHAGFRRRSPAYAPRLRTSRPGSFAGCSATVLATGGLTFGILRFLG